MDTKFGLPFKIALLSFLITGAGVLGIAYLAYRSADTRLGEHAMANLSDDLKREAGLLRSDIDDLRNNVITLSMSPPVSGIIRATEGGGYDDEENATIDMWKNRLLTLFRAVLQQRPAYDEISFIGVAENGREIVRSEMVEGRIEVVEEEGLQEKGHRDYFNNTISIPRGQVYFSQVNYNREHGKVQVPYVPRLRACVPVYTDEGKVFGVIKIGVNFNTLTERLKYPQRKNICYFIANEQGDYLSHPDEKKCFAFEFGRQSRVQDDYPVEDIYSRMDETGGYPGLRIPGQEVGVALHLLHFDPTSSYRYLLLGAVASYALLEEESISFRNQLIVIVSGVVVVLSIVIALSTRYLTRPIKKLTDVSNRIASGEEGVEVPAGGSDEVGALAQSMRTMLSSLARSCEKLIASEQELRELNESLEQRVADRTVELAKANESLQAEIVERRHAEEQIETSLKEKEVLLREIHHRVKNNMQIIISMLKLQSRHKKGDQFIDDILRDSQRRVKAMALVHEKLYQTEDLAKIDFQEYTKHLTNGILRSFGSSVGNVELKVDVEGIVLEIDTAILCGLIINELIANSLKYAFPASSPPAGGDNGRGEISITMHRDTDTAEHELELIIRDNGVGIPGDLDIRNTKTLGLYLVNTLVRQLNGELHLNRDKGTEFHIKFKEMKYRERI